MVSVLGRVCVWQGMLRDWQVKVKAAMDEAKSNTGPKRHPFSFATPMKHTPTHTPTLTSANKQPGAALTTNRSPDANNISNNNSNNNDDAAIGTAVTKSPSPEGPHHRRGPSGGSQLISPTSVVKESGFVVNSTLSTPAAQGPGRRLSLLSLVEAHHDNAAQVNAAIKYLEEKRDTMIAKLFLDDNFASV